MLDRLDNKKTRNDGIVRSSCKYANFFHQYSTRASETNARLVGKYSNLESFDSSSRAVAGVDRIWNVTNNHYIARYLDRVIWIAVWSYHLPME